MSVGARSAVLQADETDHQREREARWRWIGVGTTVVGAQPPYSRARFAAQRLLGETPRGGVVSDGDAASPGRASERPQ